jgi:hypothetical protein
MTLAKILTTVFKFEKKCESLKVALFRQEELRYADEKKILNTIFRQVDVSLTSKISAQDLIDFLKRYHSSVKFPLDIY